MSTTITIQLQNYMLIIFVFLIWISVFSNAAPLSKPYIPFRTSPFDQDGVLHHIIDWESGELTKQRHRISTVRKYDAGGGNVSPPSNKLCPLQFELGISKKWHSPVADDVTDQQAHAIRTPPILQTVFPARGPGKQVIYTTQYEHVDLLSPTLLVSKAKVIKEALLQAPQFPLLMESSSFLTSPILHDVNGDGTIDVITADYDGGITIMSLSNNNNNNNNRKQTNGKDTKAKNHYFHHAQVPRIYIRREWIHGRIHEILQDIAPDQYNFSNPQKDPYHSYFEFYYRSQRDNEKDILRGVTANIFGQDSNEAEKLASRKASKQTHKRDKKIIEETKQESKKSEIIDLSGQIIQEESNDKNIPILSGDGVVNATTTVTTSMPQDGSNHQDSNPILEGDVTANGNTENIQVGENKKIGEEATGSGKDNVTNSVDANPPNEEHAKILDGSITASDPAVTTDRRRLQEVEEDNNNEQVDFEKEREGDENAMDDDFGAQRNERLKEYETMDDMQIPELDMQQRIGDEDDVRREQEMQLNEDAAVDDVVLEQEEQDRHRHGYDDDYRAYRGGHGDDVYDGHEMGDDEFRSGYHHEYYSTKNYLRVTPHILTDPVLVEAPKLYGNAMEKEEVLLVPVSYYLDEDEYDGLLSYNRYMDADDIGDETEVRRGTFVANAIMAYSVGGNSPRWMSQVHLDLSTDYLAPPNATLLGELPERPDRTMMGAFALSTPTVADIDGDGNPDVIVGTSMGIVYVFDARQLFKRANWPIQMKYPIESRILVEDVQGDTNLEIFIADIGSNIVCFNHQGEVIWNRNLLISIGKADVKLSGSSPMTLGDIDGDGYLDLVVLIWVAETSFLFALNAANGDDKSLFPIELTDGKPTVQAGMEELHQKLPQPLLVDLHADQAFLQEYLRRNGTVWRQPKPSKSGKAPHGGFGPGLHIVQPVGKELYIIEGASGCSQKISIGDEVSAMIQVEDVHGTNLLDLVIATESGNIATLETQAPYHPLNTWSHGEVRGRLNTHAHGYSASQGIFVHDISRQFVDIFGVYVPITFEIFDNRPGISLEPSKKTYNVEIRDGPSWNRVLWKNQYSEPGVYSDRFYVKYGPGYYTFHIVMMTSHGIIYEDSFSIGYNVHYMTGFGILLWLPLFVASLAILLCGTKKTSWVDDDYDSDRQGRGLGILGRSLP